MRTSESSAGTPGNGLFTNDEMKRNRDGREGCAYEAANAVAEIGDDRLEAAAGPGVARGFLDGGNVTERAGRSGTGRIRR
jgi:hypothetical protein